MKLLSTNQLKVLAIIFMTIDHIGYMLFPKIALFRMLGRLAFPLFAFTFGEGCMHTKNRTKHFLTLCVMAFLCQIVYTFVTNSLYMNILVTLAMSAALIYSFDIAKRWDTILAYIFPGIVLIAIFYICCMLPYRLKGTGFSVDYGFLGVMLPVLVYHGEEKNDKLFLLALGLLALGAAAGKTQLLSLFALPILYFYNGRRGRMNMKYFFYAYYPLHLIIIFMIGMLLR